MMKRWLVGLALLISWQGWAQLPQTQDQYWRQVDEQMRQQEQERWAREMNEQARMWQEQQAWEQEEENWRASEAPPPDSMGVMLRQSAAMAEVTRDLKPERGFWEYHAVGQEYRAAMFINSQGMISVHGPGGSYRGALLMLWGPKIPAPPALSVIPVSLQQNDEPAQKVRTFNYGFPGMSGWGTLIFVVPSGKALVDNMEEVHNFKATIGDQLVFSSGWIGGKAAAARL